MGVVLLLGVPSWGLTVGSTIGPPNSGMTKSGRVRVFEGTKAFVKNERNF